MPRLPFSLRTTLLAALFAASAGSACTALAQAAAPAPAPAASSADDP